MTRKFFKLALVVMVMLFGLCMKWEYGMEEYFDMSASGQGLFICNEGNFQYSNATLS